jgi:hypothetical protein
MATIDKDDDDSKIHDAGSGDVGVGCGVSGAGK